MKWLVAVAYVHHEFLSRPIEFLSNPHRRGPVNWAVGVVDAEDATKASELAMSAWTLGELTGGKRGQTDTTLNWYVAPFPEDTPRDEGATKPLPRSRTRSSNRRAVRSIPTRRPGRR
jgi:hypothetical protein